MAFQTGSEKSKLQGSLWGLTASTFWLAFLGGVIWAVGGLGAFTGTNKLGMAKAFGIWAPLNIIVSRIWGAVLFYRKGNRSKLA